MEYANRENVQEDEDVRSLINWERFGPELPRWRKAVQGIAALTGRMIDSSFLRSLESRIFKNRHREAEL